MPGNWNDSFAVSFMHLKLMRDSGKFTGVWEKTRQRSDYRAVKMMGTNEGD